MSAARPWQTHLDRPLALALTLATMFALPEGMMLTRLALSKSLKSGRLRTAAPDDAADDLKIEGFFRHRRFGFLRPGAKTVIILSSSLQRICRSLNRA